MLYLLTLHCLWFFCRCAIDPTPTKRQKVNVYKTAHILFFPNTLILLSACKSAVLYIVNRIEFFKTWEGLITYARQSPWMYTVGCPRMWHRLYTIPFLWFWLEIIIVLWGGGAASSVGQAQKIYEHTTSVWGMRENDIKRFLYTVCTQSSWTLVITYNLPYISCFSIQSTYDFSVIAYHKPLLTSSHIQIALLAHKSSHLHLLPLWILLGYFSLYSTSCFFTQILTEDLAWDRKGRKIQPQDTRLWNKYLPLQPIGPNLFVLGGYCSQFTVFHWYFQGLCKNS